MSLYLILNLAAFIVPFIFSFHPKILFYKEWKFTFPAMILTGLVFVVWDISFVHKGIWGFNPKYLQGFFLFNLPLEEYLFFLCIPYSCVFSYYSIRKFLPGISFAGNFRKWIVFLFATILLVIGLAEFQRWYTSLVFIFSAVSMLITYYFFRNALDYFFITYVIMLAPFFIINGILTGSFIKGEVVWYNNDYNLGIRLLTIPVEDFFYGMMLILWNINMSYLFSRIYYPAK